MSPLLVGLSDSARTRPIADGRVEVEGHDLDVTLMGVQDLFNHQLSEHTFDICEFPLGTYLRTLENPEQPYLAVPFFPSRHFRLSSLYASEKSEVASLADLSGRRIGIPTFDMAAGVWLRGILDEHHGVDRFSPTYVIGGLEHARVGDEHPQFYPDGFTFEHRTDTSLAQLLATGEIDALMTARAPSTYPDGGVRRLLADPRTAELEYHRATGIFPAMHVLAIKRPLAEAHPDLPMALLRAFTSAQAIAREQLLDSSALESWLPWEFDHVLETERLLGPDPWPVGLAANRAMLAKAIEYCLADGLITTAVTPEDLFRGPGETEVLYT